MRPYTTFRFSNFPDVGDIKAEGRKSSAGQLPGKSGEYHSLTRNPNRRRQVRRTLKRSDKARVSRMLRNMEF
jgi:hypothetical protein